MTEDFAQCPGYLFRGLDTPVANRSTTALHVVQALSGLLFSLSPPHTRAEFVAKDSNTNIEFSEQRPPCGTE